MTPSPRVSVLVPTYNYGRYIEEAIQSVLDQSFTDFELIIVDDYSSDNTGEVIKKFLGDKRVSFYRNDSNKGMAGNFNQCLSYARGEYIKYLNSDDRFHPLLLEKFVEAMECRPGISLVACNLQFFGSKQTGFDLPLSGHHTGKYIITESIKTHNWIGAPSSTMFRRVQAGKGFRNDFSWITDWDMWLRLLTVGDCYIIAERLVDVRWHAAQATSLLNKNYIARFEEYQFYREIYDENKFEFDENDLKRIVKVKAASCATVVYKTLPQLAKRSNRALFKKALNIALKEKVLFKPISKVLGRG